MKKITYIVRNINLNRDLSEILAGSIWALSGRVGATFLALLFSIVVARSYGAEVLGIISVVQALLMMVVTITVLGFDTSLLRLIPEYMAKHSVASAILLYRKAMYVVVISSLCSGSVLYFFADLIAINLFNNSNLSYYFKCLSFFVLFKSLLQVKIQVMRSFGMIRAFSVMQILPYMFSIALLLIFDFFNISELNVIYSVLFGYCCAWIVATFVVEYFSWRKINYKISKKSIKFIELISLSLPMLMTSSMIFVVGQAGVLVMGIYCSGAEVGYFDVAVKFSSVFSFVLFAVNSVVAPRISELFHKNKIEELFNMARMATKIIFYTTLPVLLFYVIFGRLFISVAYGKSFDPVFVPMLILAGGQFFNSISGSTGIFLNMTGNQLVYRNIMFCAAILNLILNFIFIPKYGALGASFVASFTIVFWNVAILVYMKINFQRTTAYFPFWK